MIDKPHADDNRAESELVCHRVEQLADFGFLMELARYALSEKELSDLLDEADGKLKGVLEQ